MDFNDSTEEAAYREKARAWLAENAAAHRAKWGELKPNTPEHMAAAKEWQATKASAGYACITWPAAIGGRPGDAGIAGAG
ncbi:acyl-CoA dehydrogenase family protein, partial [Caulobacter sp. CCH5-E12]|uniref:acyl-CoA dehydrogenase family protein n=1 Tax=Caulobacter sp. CCH5-E12 TaxID=1768770 RepID=UPI000A6C3516